MEWTKEQYERFEKIILDDEMYFTLPNKVIV